jgi:hypothetical protein
MTYETAAELLRRIGVTDRKIVAWAGDRTPAQAWDECPRGDWLLQWAQEAGVDRQLLVRGACACVRLVLHLVPDAAEFPRVTVETAEAWTRGEATLVEVRVAGETAAAAAAAAVWITSDAAVNAAVADCAGWAAIAATDARVAANAAAAAAVAAGWGAFGTAARNGARAAAYAVAYAAARAAMHRRCANAVREVIPECPTKGKAGGLAGAPPDG